MSSYEWNPAGIRINTSDNGPTSKGFIALLYHSAIKRKPDICSKLKNQSIIIIKYQMVLILKIC